MNRFIPYLMMASALSAEPVRKHEPLKPVVHLPEAVQESTPAPSQDMNGLPRREISTQTTHTGTLVPGGISCPLFKTNKGKLYTLIGNGLEILQPKAQYQISVEWPAVKRSNCMQNETLRVTSIREIGAKSPK